MKSNHLMKPFISKAVVEITKESGEVIREFPYAYEVGAQRKFEEIERIRSPRLLDGLTMNLSEYPEGRIGSVRVVAISRDGDRFVRRELYRKA